MLRVYRVTCPKLVADRDQVAQHDLGVVVHHLNLNAVRQIGKRLVYDFTQQQLNLLSHG